ncbi:MAG: hypothetical protein M1837_006434 [Sclerophora amabilis]|nr:MAG: hypothetical protein M1837_006434 [Sclerophora amabilis]
MREIDPLISSFTHLKEKTREAEALKSLQKVASLVKPIMRQRGWRVGNLTEFYPQERNLLGLNWNKGQQICLRLRYPGDERQFLPLEQVVDTMLHELSHIVHDAHDAKFHALWQQLREEHEQLASKGYTGEGFLSKGKKLGGKRIPMDEARRQARASAERRRARNAGSGQRLGGMPVQRGADMRQVIADATQRRLTVTKGCGSGTKNSKAIVDQATKSGFRTQAEEDDANERAIMQAYIELVQEEEKEKWGDAYVAPSQQNPTGSAYKGESTSSSPPSSSSSTKPAQGSNPTSSKPQPSVPHPPARRPETPSSSSRNSSNIIKPQDLPSKHPPRQLPTPTHSAVTSWTCPICTLENPLNYLCCDACTTERPLDLSLGPSSSPSSSPEPQPEPTQQQTRSKPRQEPLSAKSPSTASTSADWICHRCGTYMEAQWWTCSRCSTMKLRS